VQAWLLYSCIRIVTQDITPLSLSHAHELDRDRHTFIIHNWFSSIRPIFFISANQFFYRTLVSIIQHKLPEVCHLTKYMSTRQHCMNMEINLPVAFLYSIDSAYIATYNKQLL
jgi:hypothetical protein